MAARTPAPAIASSTLLASPGIERTFWASVGRAFGGALFFSLPMLMTMEMWWLGFYMDRVRLALLIVLNIPLLTGLARLLGFWRNTTWAAAAREAFVGYGVGIVTAVGLLAVLGVLKPPFYGNETIGKVALQTVPASMGAIVAAGQFGGGGKGKEARRRAGYGTHTFFTFAGAVFLAFAVAPTEEMILIAFKMDYGRAFLLALGTLTAMHATTQLTGFRSAHGIPPSAPWWSVFLRYTAPAYAIALLVSAYVLWTFGRLDNTALSWDLTESIVLGFPAGLGAAGARALL